MAILRNPGKCQYTNIDNKALRDPRLSLKARGLLVTMLSFPDSWEFSENGLEQIFPKDGQASIRTGLKELEKSGYLTRSRKRDSKGVFTHVEWFVTDDPQCDFPRLDNPNLEKPNLENPPQSNNNISNTNKSNNDKPSKPKPVRHKYGYYKNVYLSAEDEQKLRTEFPNDWKDRIENLSEYMEIHGKSYKNHLAVIRNWARRDQTPQTPYPVKDERIDPRIADVANWITDLSTGRPIRYVGQIPKPSWVPEDEP